MARKRVLLTVTTYPLPSRSYDELVCTAGVLEDGSWIRIYPVPLSFLVDLKQSGQLRAGLKYTWLDMDLERRNDDFRPESHSPVNRDFSGIHLLDHLDTDKGTWAERKRYCLQNVYTDMAQLVADSRSDRYVSLATFKPTRIVGMDVEKDEADWKAVWKALQQQGDLFAEGDETGPRRMIPKVPYKFFYRFEDMNGKRSRMMVEDWEIGALYWHCSQRAATDEEAVQKVKQKYVDEFLEKRDLYFFLGTSKQWHKRAKNPFIIIGVFYPMKEKDDKQFKLEL